MTLEDKIYKYLKAGTFADLKIVAKEITEIADNYIADKVFNLIDENTELKQRILNLSDENLNLQHSYKMFKDMYDDIKSKLDNVKYLDYKEVEKIIMMSDTIKEAITAICNLALKK